MDWFGQFGDEAALEVDVLLGEVAWDVKVGGAVVFVECLEVDCVPPFHVWGNGEVGSVLCWWDGCGVAVVGV